MRKPDEEIYTQGILYLQRWWLLKKQGVRVYLHHIKASDAGRELHDHVSDSISIILWGGYIEHVFARPPVEGQELPPVIEKRRRMFSIIRRKAEDAHRLELLPTNRVTIGAEKWNGECDAGSVIFISKEGETHCTKEVPVGKPCWSIFITWRKRREWGFWCEERGVIGKVPFFPFREMMVDYERLDLNYYGMLGHWIHNQQFFEKGCA